MGTKQRNIPALISLCMAVCAVVCLVLSCIPMKELRVLGNGTGKMLSGGINVIFSAVAFAAAVAALISGIVAKGKGKDKKASIGKAVGILCIFASLLIGFCVSAIALLNDYANDPTDSLLGRSVTDNEKRKQLDDLISQMTGTKSTSEKSSSDILS